MSRKQIRKVHIDDKEYVYVIKKGYPDGTFVNVYESGNKSDAFCQLEYPEYTKVTPSMVKEGIVKELSTQIINEEIIKKLKGEQNDLV
tara:strand:- start:1983 stop:2246 length:264 start_codon:yes stop_codon:yes gene_type:complete